MEHPETKYIAITCSLMAKIDSFIFDSCLLNKELNLSTLNISIDLLKDSFNEYYKSLNSMDTKYMIKEITDTLYTLKSYIDSINIIKKKKSRNNSCTLGNLDEQLNDIEKEFIRQRNLIIKKVLSCDP